MIRRDSYLAVVLLLLGASAVGIVLAIVGYLKLGNPAMMAAGVAFWLSSGMLAGVAVAQSARTESTSTDAPGLNLPASSIQTDPASGEPAEAPAPPVDPYARVRSQLKIIRGVTAATAGLATANVLLSGWTVQIPPPVSGIVAGTIALAAAWLATISSQYLETVDPARLPEAPGLARGGRVLAFVLFLNVAAIVLAGVGAITAVRLVYVLAITLTGVVWFELSAETFSAQDLPVFPTDLTTFSVLGSRANPLASALDAAERHLGIDLRSTWALDVVRRGAGWLLVGLMALGWLTTAATVVGIEEQGLIEHLGVPLDVPPLESGLHLHWPWPIDRVILVPVLRVQTLHIGHEEEAREGPEDVLWARQHSKSEYTLLLGNGRDLIAVDATLDFRISDPRAWYYHCQNPAQALSAIGYRAVMRSTVNRTLQEALSENVGTLTAQMRTMVQAEADALGLGVKVVAFNVGGMHPPVQVATDYQAVVSAEVTRTTAAIRAQAYRNAILPRAEADVLGNEKAALAAAAEAEAKAGGEAWSFGALEPVFRAAPEAFKFRRRLETLETNLAGRTFTILDDRIQRDGGELWLMK